MLPKDFENYELRLRKLQESSRESYLHAMKLFSERYENRLVEFLPNDVLGTLASIRTVFCVKIAEHSLSLSENTYSTILKESIKKACSLLPLSFESINILIQSLYELVEHPSLPTEFIHKEKSLRKDPIFPILEDILLDGKISPEEILLLENHYTKDSSLQKHVDILPEKSRRYIKSELSDLASKSIAEKKDSFGQEYQQKLAVLEAQGYHTEALISFVAVSYYIPKKRFETPEKRLKRTFKMALLRLLRFRFAGIDIETLLKRFEDGETFEDFFLLLYKLFERIQEEPQSKEVFFLEEKKQVVHSLLETAAFRKEKIMAGEQVTAKMTDIISQTDTNLESGVLSALLEDDTHFLGQEIYFAHTDTLAGVYAQSVETQEEDDEIDAIISGDDTLLGKYEALKEYFFKLDEQKRKAFASGDYEEIDRINDILFRLDSQLQKLSLLLGESEVL